jgi:hypothetical protein
MTERAEQLHTTADGQIKELVSLLLRIDDATLRLPCPGREKLGDGTVGALARHTADNYGRIAAFVQRGDPGSLDHQPMQPGAHRIPRFLRARGHRPVAHASRAGQHDRAHAVEDSDPGALIRQLSASRESLRQVAGLTDDQLDAIPPKDSFRFCDGKRTLEQVLAGLLKHQNRQLHTLRTTVP